MFVAAALTVSGVRIDGLRDAALSWHIPPQVTVIRGLRLCMDAGRTAPPAMKLAREVMRTNPRLGAVDSLMLATEVLEAGREHGLAPQFLAATLLQESAFDPFAVSSAGAVGIAQFTVPTALEYGVDPWEPHSAIAGAARVLSAYVDSYRGRDEDPYALALAAYNAGPLAVTRYGGVPPYPETRDYITDVRDRWSRIIGR
ncbi:MAG: lytic transglycosylase protein [Candidatus Eremiobacteraeota bacterium]|nr:lytic transglycosylase protein [Candidatus Eremiobacteraeota bacterium]